VFYRGLIALRRNEPDLADPWLSHLVVDYDDDQRWIVMRRGSIAIACNLGEQRVRVPATGEVLLGWGEPDVGTSGAGLPGHSVVIVKSG